MERSEEKDDISSQYAYDLGWNDACEKIEYKNPFIDPTLFEDYLQGYMDAEEERTE